MFDEKFRMRVCIWYDLKQGKLAAESHRALFNVFGEEALSESQCREWFRRFQSGDESLNTDIDLKSLKAAIKSDPCQTIRNLAEWFSCGHTPIADHLHAIGKTN